jgi:hypothetical protein
MLVQVLNVCASPVKQATAGHTGQIWGSMLKKHPTHVESANQKNTITELLFFTIAVSRKRCYDFRQKLWRKYWRFLFKIQLAFAKIES